MDASFFPGERETSTASSVNDQTGRVFCVAYFDNHRGATRKSFFVFVGRSESVGTLPGRNPGDL